MSQTAAPGRKDDRRPGRPECSPNMPRLRRHWWETAGWGRLLMVLYVVFAALPAVLAWALTPQTRAPLAVELGRGAALTGFALLTLQFALSGRFRGLDQPFDLHLVMRHHRAMAVLATALLVLHPVLLAWGGRGRRLFTLQVPWPVHLGQAALVLLVLIVLFSLTFPYLGVEYQHWRYVHKSVIAVVVLGFLHSLFWGRDLEQLSMRIYWGVLLSGVAGIYLYRNVLLPLWLRRRFDVEFVRQETHDTYTLALRPQDGTPLEHRPGQFIWLKLLRPGYPSESHPFTISSSPTREWPLTVTVKESGDYTDTIGRTRAGDTAEVGGPYGRFSLLFRDVPQERFLFVAGGVGITPIMSMLRYLVDTGDGRPALLLYANKTRRDVLFREEMAEFPDNIRVVHVLSRPSQEWEGRTGRVTADVIREEAGEALTDAYVYVCGPPPMMDSVIDALRELGVEEGRIYYERFAI